MPEVIVNGVSAAGTVAAAIPPSQSPPRTVENAGTNARQTAPKLA